MKSSEPSKRRGDEATKGCAGARVLRRGGFTLAELLVVMAIIAILAALTVVSVGAIAQDAKLSSGTNAVVAAIDNARALAMRRNRPVLVVFRPRLDGNEPYVEAITAVWSGDVYVEPSSRLLYDRFVPIADVPARALPRGIQVAGPYYREPDTIGNSAEFVYGRRADTVWVTQSYLPLQPAHVPPGRTVEAPGELVGIMYGPDGSTVTRNPQNDSRAPWVDFDNDFNNPNEDGFGEPELPGNRSSWEGAVPGSTFWLFIDEDDETPINVVPFVAVYDDDLARDFTGAVEWRDHQTRTLELSDYITERADRIHFNRYTGVVMR